MHSRRCYSSATTVPDALRTASGKGSTLLESEITDGKGDEVDGELDELSVIIVVLLLLFYLL